MVNFEIIKESGSEFIYSRDKDLTMQVIPQDKQPTNNYPKGVLILTAMFNSPLQDELNVENKESIDFAIILPKKEPSELGWTMDLFYDAIDYYCELQLDRPNNGISYSNNPGFYPFGGE